MVFERILVVCIGNICRSPMAAALLGHNLASHNPAVEVQSAGLAALVGYPADPLAQELLRERGIDLSDHRARQLTAAMVMDADLVLAMETAQVKMVESMLPGARGRVHRLGKAGAFDVPDPYGRSRDTFVQALGLIDQGLTDWQSRL